MSFHLCIHVLQIEDWVSNNEMLRKTVYILPILFISMQMTLIDCVYMFTLIDCVYMFTLIDCVYMFTYLLQTIAKRLTESKQTIPHYYLTIDVTLDQTLK